MVIPMKVAPNSAAAGAGPDRSGDGGQRDPDRLQEAPPGDERGRGGTRRLSHVQAAQEGIAAPPTMIQTLLDSHDGPVAEMAATRNVPATM